MLTDAREPRLAMGSIRRSFISTACVIFKVLFKVTALEETLAAFATSRRLLLAFKEIRL